MKIVRAIFEKFEILIFFLCELPLILGVGGKLKKTRDIYMRTLYIEFERDRSIGLGSTFGDGHTDRSTDRQTDRQTERHTHTHTHTHRHTQTHTQTFFLKHFFRL